MTRAMGATRCALRASRAVSRGSAGTAAGRSSEKAGRGVVGGAREPHETLYFHFSTDRALRQGPWKLVSAKLGRWELYNLDEDRTETSDLAAKHPDKVEEMKKEWFRLAKNVDRLKGKQLAPAGEELKKLNFRKYLNIRPKTNAGSKKNPQT